MFLGPETCPSRFLTRTCVHFVFLKNILTKLIFAFRPYFLNSRCGGVLRNWNFDDKIFQILFQITKCTLWAIKKTRSKFVYHKWRRHNKAAIKYQKYTYETYLNKHLLWGNQKWYQFLERAIFIARSVHFDIWNKIKKKFFLICPADSYGGVYE